MGQEGGHSAQTQKIYAAEAPFAVPSTESEASAAKIFVVPNPYIGVGVGRVEGQESHSYGGTPKIRFVGVPSHCRIRVFSSSGQQVANIRHLDPAKGEADFDQFTEYYMGSITSGVYYYVIENLIDGGNKGKLQRGTFMVIR